MNKAETLLESLISLFILSMVIIPVINSTTYARKVNYKISNDMYFNENIKNILEDIKALDYEKIEVMQGEYIFDDIENLCLAFSLDSKYYHKIEGKIKVKIEKSIYYYNFNKKEYIFNISVNDYEEIYIP